MSDMSQEPAEQNTMDMSAPETRFSDDLTSRSDSTGQSPQTRLQAIHELVRSGGYNIPATAIADRMIERMIADRRRRRC